MEGFSLRKYKKAGRKQEMLTPLFAPQAGAGAHGWRAWRQTTRWIPTPKFTLLCIQLQAVRGAPSRKEATVHKKKRQRSRAQRRIKDRGGNHPVTQRADGELGPANTDRSRPWYTRPWIDEALAFLFKVLLKVFGEI